MVCLIDLREANRCGYACSGYRFIYKSCFSGESYVVNISGNIP